MVERRKEVPRAVISDVDGTLTDSQRRMDFGALRAIRSLSDRGVPVIFATGNVLPVVLGLYRFLGLSTPIIAENGGLVYFPDDRIVRLARRAPAWKAYLSLRKELPVRTLFTDRWRETEVALEPTVPAEEVASRVAPLGIKVEHTGFAIHLFQPTAGKLAAARIALEGMGLSLEDCLFAGDGDNDVELLRAVGVGVSFPDASPRARAAADYVTRARHGAGFLEALKRFGLMPGPREGVH